MSKSSNLPDPPEDDYFRFIPLGGLDEVGMNCALVECNGSMLMVDCGYTFPDEESFGVDTILPDWSYVLENVDRLDGVLVTHAHQDHIGALPFFLQKVDVPVYGGAFTLSMLEDQLEEQDLADAVDLFDVGTEELLELGPFTIEFVHVNHSVPNARSIALDTPAGRYLFTGDWKLDQTARYEPVADLQTFAEFGRAGTTAVFGDSTNAEVPGYSTSEQEVFENIASVVDSSDGRVIVSQFSSNLYRLNGLLDAAYEQDRKVLLLGRSLRDAKELGLERGLIELPDDDLLLKPHEADQLPDEQLLVIATGSQAEPRASLTRMSRGDHHHVTIKEGDTVVISARIIPGNQRGIQDMVDHLSRRGASVLQAKTEPIHGSGHACTEEMKLLLNLTDPDYLVPVHGHYSMRSRHAEIGESVGVPEQPVIEDGDVLEFVRGEASVVGEVRAGRVIVDGKNVGDLEDVELRDRAELARSGTIAAFVVIDRSTGELASDPKLSQHGFIGEEEANLLDGASSKAKQALRELSPDARRNYQEAEEAIRAAVRDYFRDRINRKPVVIPIIHKL